MFGVITQINKFSSRWDSLATIQWRYFPHCYQYMMKENSIQFGFVVFGKPFEFWCGISQFQQLLLLSFRVINGTCYDLKSFG